MKSDPEMEAFKADLMEAVRDMKSGRAARVTRVTLPPAANVRAKTGLSQSKFAALMGVSMRTLQNWEQGRTQPSGAAKTLLAVAERHPETLHELAVS